MISTLHKIIAILNGNTDGEIQLNPDEKNLKKILKKEIKPDPKNSIQFHENVIIVTPGSTPPYFLGNKIVSPTTVFWGETAERMPYIKIKETIQESDGEEILLQRSLLQNLTLASFKNTCKTFFVDFSKDFLRKTRLILNNNLYSNLGLIFSKQNPFSITVATYEGQTIEVLTDEKKFTGPILEQYVDALSFLKNKSELHDANGTVTGTAFPFEAINESLLNAIIHRDYSIQSDIVIRLYPDRMEIVSPGGTQKNFSPDDLKQGIPFPRNKNLSDIFKLFHYTENMGTGIKRIFTAYHKSSQSPKISISQNVFKVVLPIYDLTYTATPAKSQMEYVLSLFDNNPTVSRTDIERALCVSRATAARIANAMVEKDILQKIGTGRYVYYVKKEGK